MTIQMTAFQTTMFQTTVLSHTADSIRVNNMYSCHSTRQTMSATAPLAKPNSNTGGTGGGTGGSTGAISEVIIPGFSDSKTIVPTIIASLTQQASDRWITWITASIPNKALLSSLGACLSRLRIVYINPEGDARWVIWQALAQGNSHNVVAEQTHFSLSDIERMEVAATQGECKGMLISCA